MASIIDPVAMHARVRPQARAIVNLEDGRSWTYAAFDAEIDRVAAWLIARFGGRSGALVASLAKNCVEIVLLQQACIRAGAIFVPFNWRLALPEIERLANDARPDVLFHDADMPVPAGASSSVVIDQLTALAANASASPDPAARLGFDETCTLLYTSGTSGTPKAVMVTVANTYWGSANFMHGYALTPDSVFLCDMPLFHTAGLFGPTGASLLAGGTVLISRLFDATTTLARLADPVLGITHYFSVPQMAQMLWDAPGFRPDTLARLQVYATGGAPNPPAQIERFVAAGIAMSDGFGMSETCSNFVMPPDDPALLLAKAGSSGKALLSVDVRIADDDGHALPPGRVGELWLAGPSVSPGYWRQEALTNAAFADGWFRSGDLARLDEDGFLFLVDRKKDMYISGGENVYPAEVEAAILELSAIAEVAVVGLSDERWGESGCAYIVLRGGATLTEGEIVAHCTARLARFKVPRSVAFTDRIPRTASGKIQKNLLRERAVR